MHELSLAAKAVEILTQRGLTLALAESCTGGGIASAITDIAGASSVLQGGVVVYTAQAKFQMLELQEDELPRGCVDSELTRKMAARVRNRFQADLGLGITGALGPQSPAPCISVGEIYIAVASQEKSAVSQFNFTGDRQTIKKTAVDAALNLLLAYVARWYVA